MLGRRSPPTKLRACRGVQTRRGSIKTIPKKGETSGSFDAQTARSRRMPTGRRSANSGGSLGLFRDWQRTPTQSSATALHRPRQQMDVRFCKNAGTISPRGTCALRPVLIRQTTRSPEREQKSRAFSLTSTYMDAGDSPTTLSRSPFPDTYPLADVQVGFKERVALYASIRLEVTAGWRDGDEEVYRTRGGFV